MLKFATQSSGESVPPHRHDDYDTADGILYHYLNDGLAGLNRLAADRSGAGYGRDERMSEFVIMGRWLADTCGNFALITEPKEGLGPTMVVPIEFMVKDCRFSASFGSFLPPNEVLCPVCNKAWDLSNAHDTYSTNGSEIIDSPPGLTVKLFNENLRFQKATEGRLQQVRRERGLRNDKYIDLTHDLCDYGKKKGQPKEWPRNEHGWVDAEPDHVLEKGDQLDVVYWTYYHRECHKNKLGKDHYKFFAEVAKEAGFAEFFLEVIPNEYCQCDACGPWFLLKQGSAEGVRTLKIGWRKNVMNLDWGDYTKAEVVSRFKDEDVTKWEGGIHAWGREKAVEYLKVIREAANVQ